MKESYCKTYSLNESGINPISEHERHNAINSAMNLGHRMIAFENKLEMYLFLEGVLIVDDTLEDGNNFEVHSLTREGLEKLSRKLGLP